MTPSLLEDLRTATRESHRQLEDALRIETVLDRPADYRALLARFLGIQAPLEARLAATPGLEALGYDSAERSKLAALRQDLLELGAAPNEIDSLPRCEVPPFSEMGAALGAAYVMEGSTLGGQAITRMIAARGAELPAHFFNVYGAQTRERWLEFQECLRRHDEAGAAHEPVTRAAVELFDTFRKWLTQT